MIMNGPQTHPIVLKVIVRPINAPFVSGVECMAIYESLGVALNPFPNLSKILERSTKLAPFAIIINGFAIKEKIVPRRNIGLQRLSLSEIIPESNLEIWDKNSVAESISPIATRLIPNVSFKKNGVIANVAVDDIATNKVVIPTAITPDGAFLKFLNMDFKKLFIN